MKYIIPLTDVEVDAFIRNRALFEEKSIVICLSSEKTIRLCRHKKLLQEFVDKNVPEVQAIPTLYAKDLPEPPFDFPMLAKPYNGRSSQGIYKITEYLDWEYFVKKEDTSQYIIQPFIRGNIITVDVVRDYNGANTITVPREELLRTANGAGTSVNSSSTTLA